MPGFTKDEALAFLDATRLMLEGRVGYRWLTDRLSDLTDYIEAIAADNELLNAYLDSVGSRPDFESYRAQHGDTV
jgi:hypothetical protein